MKIGFLHSFRTNLGNIANAKMYRIMYEDWKRSPDYWLRRYYGEETDRYVLRGLIYNHREYHEEFQDFNNYSLIALSLNFETYAPDFSKFVTAVINDLYKNFPILHQKEVIIMAGNEVFEKRGSAEKVVRTTWDTKMGTLSSVNPNIEVCSWNEKIRTSEEKKAFEEVLDNQQHKSACKYVGIQSLETTPETMRYYTQLAQSKGYEVIDVELMTKTYRLSEIKVKFDNDKLLRIDKVFIGCPYISEQLADYNDMFNKYALSIGDFKKDKFKLVQYIQQFREDEQEEEMNKMFDDILLGICYVKGTRGWGVKRIQKIFNIWAKETFNNLEFHLIEDGLFGSKTKNMLQFYQTENFLTIDGIAGRETLTSMFNFMLKRYDK